MIALLTAALAGPYFIDWTAQRGLVEAQLGKLLGAPVATRGAIDLKLLPTPRLVLDGVETGQTSGLSLRSGRVKLELAMAPLLRGDLRFIEASFESPDIGISAGVDGSLPLRLSTGNPGGDAAFERIAIANGRLRLLDASGGATLELSDLDLEAEATSLAGPFKASGSFTRAGGRAAFRFNTGVIENERLRLKLIIDEAGGLPRADLDGVLAAAPASLGQRVVFEGPAIFSGKAFGGWRMAGPLKLDLTGMSVDPLEARLGGEDAAQALSGTGALLFGAAPSAQFTLAARQFDTARERRRNARRGGQTAISTP